MMMVIDRRSNSVHLSLLVVLGYKCLISPTIWKYKCQRTARLGLYSKSKINRSELVVMNPTFSTLQPSPTYASKDVSLFQ